MGINSRSPRPRLSRRLILLIPKPRLVRRPARIIPRLDKHTISQPTSANSLKNLLFPAQRIILLRLIHIILRLHLLDPDLHPLFPEAHILLLHLLGCLVRDVGGDGVDDEADEARDGEAEEEED